MLQETISTDIKQHSSIPNRKKSYYETVFYRWKAVLVTIAVVVVILSLLLVILVLLYCLIPRKVLPTSKLQRTKQNDVSYRYILFWYHDHSLTHYDYCADEGQTLFLEAKCPVNTCYITRNRNLLPIEKFDVVVFHIDHYILPEQFCQIWKTNEEPQARSPNQKYVFYLLEAPCYPPNKNYMLNYEGYFNWTMTYRLDSDIPAPYGWVVPMNASTLSPPINNRSWLTPNFEHTNKIAQTADQKPKQVAWLVSHCDTQSKREKYVAALADFIHVDIYGHCGTLYWPRSDTYGFYNMLNKTYKFYLSFESTLCSDYMTEKVFNILQYHVIPVVYGGGDYEHILPPHSYINVNTFASPQVLANYLLELSNDPEEYYKYFWWKKYYKIVYRSPQPMCKLCEMLHNNLSSKTYDHLEHWWNEEICQEPQVMGHWPIVDLNLCSEHGLY